jgi:signal peptide peptidase SppA|tara:strand:- start:1181 stop:2194 length:1014 start_codon:yes stop_codon:yes gene_type:complete
MRLKRLLDFLRNEPWAITHERLAAIEALMELTARGVTMSAEDIRARIGEVPRSDSSKRGSIAVIPLHGVISHRAGGLNEYSGGISTERFAGYFRQALGDASVRAIVMDVDSPGGTIAGVTELHQEIMAARGKKPIVAHVNALCASAGYWIASAADEIWSTPSGTVGSIGVITSHLDASKAEESEGFTRTVISAGKHKAEGFGPLTDDSLGYLQGRVDEAYGAMVADIASGRGRRPAEIRDGFGEGRVVSATSAKRMGMIDRIATFDQAIDRLSQRRASSRMAAEAGDAEQIAEAPTTTETLVEADGDDHLLGVVVRGVVDTAEDERDNELRERLERG